MPPGHLYGGHVGKRAKTYTDNDKMAAARIALFYLVGNAPCVRVPDEMAAALRVGLKIAAALVVRRSRVTTNMLPPVASTLSHFETNIVCSLLDGLN